MIHRFFPCVLFIIGLMCTFSSKGQVFNELELSAKIESLVPNAVNDTTPGLVVAVIHKGSLLYSKAYGQANLSYNIPNDTKMNYNLGSVSKQFLGYAFAILHVEGKLNVDDPVSKYLEDWPEFEEKVTIRHLLTHTSGYREAYTMSNLAGRSIGIDRLSRTECLDVVRNQPKLEYSPGSRFTYNSTAWVILAEILEIITEKPAHVWVKEHLFDPLGMNNTHIESFVGELIPNAAESYYFDQNRGYGNPKSNRAIFGAADVYSNIEDLVFWMTNFHTKEVGGESAMELFLSPFKLNDGTISEYGFGISNGIHKGLNFYSHTGAHESFLTQMRYYPDYELGIISISNFEGNGWIPTNKIAEYLLHDYMSFPPKTTYPVFEIGLDQLKEMEGIYLSPFANASTSIVMIDDTLTIWGGLKLIPISSNTFYTKSWGGKFEINRSEDGETELIIHADSKSIYHKVANEEDYLEGLKEYEAEYWSQELETSYHLILREDQILIQHRWLGEITLKPIAKDLFKSDRGWFLKIVRTDENTIKGFNINSNRTLNVFFEKK